MYQNVIQYGWVIRPKIITEGVTTMSHTVVSVRKVTTLHTYGKTFHITQDNEGNYWGIEDGLLERGIEVNGLNGHMDKDLNRCLKMCTDFAQMDSLHKKGLELEIALKYVYCPEMMTKDEMKKVCDVLLG